MTIHPDLFQWDAWRPEDAARALAGVEAPWYIAAGWAIDLFLGGERREHEDLEIAVPAARFGEVAEALSELEPVVVGPGQATPLAEAGEMLGTYHQTWMLDRAGGSWRVDVFREPSAGDTWLCRRDEEIRFPYDEVIERTAAGIPYLRPELALLFKAKHAREKDDGDLAAALPRLTAERRRLLRELLDRVHPAHRWLEEL